MLPWLIDTVWLLWVYCLKLYIWLYIRWQNDEKSRIFATITFTRPSFLGGVSSFNVAIWSRGLLSPKSYVDVPAWPQKSDFLYTNFLPNFPPINILFLKEKHPILIKMIDDGEFFLFEFDVRFSACKTCVELVYGFADILKMTFLACDEINYPWWFTTYVCGNQERITCRNTSPGVLVNLEDSKMKGQTEHLRALHLVDPCWSLSSRGHSLAFTKRSCILGGGDEKQKRWGDGKTFLRQSSSSRMLE